MRKVRFDIPVFFYIKDDEAHRSARQSNWVRMRADEDRFKRRIKAVGKLLLPFLRHGKDT